MGAIVAIVQLAIVIATIAGFWKMFTKANEPGWAAIIPIYNIIVMLKIAGKPIWFIVLYIIPLVNVIAMILVMISIAKSFGKGAGYGVGMALLAPIFVPMLGFSDAKYMGPAG